MKLHELLRDCFTESECRIFLTDEFGDTGRDVWDSTDGDWMNRAFEVAEALGRQGLANRKLFEALVRRVPGRADDVAAVCKDVTDQPLNYAAGTVPPAGAFPWSHYEAAMASSLIRLLRSAAYDARSRGYDTISTSELFRVYRAAQPWIAAAFPDAKMKTAVASSGEEDPFDDTLGASYCLSKTIHGLAEHTEQPAQFDEHDVFLDLARFGSGKSARRLSPDGTALARLNDLSRRLDIGRTTRHGVLDSSG